MIDKQPPHPGQKEGEGRKDGDHSILAAWRDELILAARRVFLWRLADAEVARIWLGRQPGPTAATSPGEQPGFFDEPEGLAP